MTGSAKARTETSAGGVVVRHGSEPLVLLIRDSYGKWGFPKGHVEEGEAPAAAAAREVAEETGLSGLTVVAGLDTISWYFHWRGRRVHKTCHFFLMESASESTSPQQAEGITECRWESLDLAGELLAYDNAREVLRRARAQLAARKQA